MHPKYRDLEPWNGSETADITYKDNHGKFTQFLIGQGYLPDKTWANARPMYFLEVKTTTRDCGEQFYMSGSQYRRVSHCQPSEQTERATDEENIIDATHAARAREIGAGNLHPSAGVRPRAEEDWLTVVSGS